MHTNIFMVVLHEKAKEKHKYLPIRERYVKCSIYTRCVIIHKSKAINSISINELGSNGMCRNMKSYERLRRKN